MATSLDRNDHKEQPRAHSRKGHGSTTGSWFRWLQHTLLFFAIPLMTLLAGPAAYNRLAAREASHPVAESQLLEIAVLMDDIYSTFERMTYLPHAAITRGPHQINTTDVPCKRDPSVLRLMELMPYVNAADLVEPLNHQKAFWIHVSQFVDYRRAYMREENCDPFNVGYDDGPTTLMLSGLNDRTYSPSFEMLYDTKYNSIRVWDGIRFLSIHDTEMPRAKHDDDSSVALFHHSIKSILAIVCRKDGVDRKTWFHAPTFLARIRDTYQSLDWTPWETSKPGGYGVSDATIKSLLRQNGWPDSFNPDQFNADFIRAKHAPSPYGPAQSAHDIVEALEPSDGKGRYHDDTIKGIQERVQKFEGKIKEAEDYQDRWAHTITLQIARWRLDASHTRLAAAKADIARLCPNATCIDPADMILWEFHNLENAYLTAQRGASIEAACENEQYDTQHYAPPSPKRMITCHSRRRREAKWWERAYTQSRAAALARCAQTGASLIPQSTFDQVAAEKIAELETEIADSHARAAIMDAYFPNIPEDAERARMLFEMEHSAAVNGPWYARERIEWVREQLGGDEEGRRRMWRCFDDEECW
ncbi:hypothetical protein FB567DRAFT_252458 [Paraphoma chrysanthemicola]|uniref:Uncharacterized protein n=1 Tax=Paraphoma chrysanthemicola TaxID=798071 RepID=A0A8K0VR60_9PLEO|nr:hypothetical protein FB567DRAFT_252458 [Paraphoma chrysanthemicola]